MILSPSRTATLPTNAVSFEFWARARSTGSLIEKRTPIDGGLGGWVFYFRNEMPRVLQTEAWFGPAARSAWANVIDTGFVHFVYTFEPVAGPRLYANARQSSTVYPGDRGAPDTVAHLLIGKGFVGELDEFAFYDHALTPQRVHEHYNARQ